MSLAKAERHLLDFLFSSACSHAASADAFSKVVRAVTLLILIVCSIVACPACSPPSARIDAAERSGCATPSVSCLEKLGLSGDVTSEPVVGKLTESGPETVFLGTSDGLYAVSSGVLQSYIYTPFGVSAHWAHR